MKPPGSAVTACTCIKSAFTSGRPTHRSWRTARGVSEEARWSLWWHPAGCSGRRSCCTWPLTLCFRHRAPLAAAAALWNRLWWSRRGSRTCQRSVRHQGVPWDSSRLALNRWSSPGGERLPPTRQQEDSGSCRRKRRERRGRGGCWDGRGCWPQASRACPVTPLRWCLRRWAGWAARRGRPAWSPARSPALRRRPCQRSVLGEAKVCGGWRRPPLWWPPHRGHTCGQSTSGRRRSQAKRCSPLDRGDNSGELCSSCTVCMCGCLLTH